MWPMNSLVEPLVLGGVLTGCAGRGGEVVVGVGEGAARDLGEASLLEWGGSGVGSWS